MLIYVKKKCFSSDGQTNVQLKTIVRNLTKNIIFIIPYLNTQNFPYSILTLRNFDSRIIP